MATGPRYPLLDALRGVAAVLVMFRHSGAFWGFGFYRSYLAVDLFFLLSGFVVAAAYGQRLRSGTLKAGRFFALRWLRLYPVYLFSLILSLAVWSFDLERAAPSLVLALFFLPWPVTGNTSLFAVNGPYWSLFYELLVNALYGLLRRWLTLPVLVALVAAGGAAVVFTAADHGNLDAGFLWGLHEAAAGLGRALFGFFLGVLLQRWHHGLPSWGRGWALLALALAGLALVAPPLPGFNGLVDVVLVTCVFPLLVLVLARAPEDRPARWARALGDASYPLYAIHAQTALIVAYVVGDAAGTSAPWSGLALLAGLLAVSVLITRAVDVPLRRVLARAWHLDRDPPPGQGDGKPISPRSP